MEIRDIHEAVLKHLLDNKQEGFSLRSKKRNEDKLNKGYWFLGNDKFLTLSFWDSKDWRNKTPNIFFGVDLNGYGWLEFVDKEAGEKASFFEEVALIMGIEQQKRFLWQSKGGDYVEFLDKFIKKDKPIIDAFIHSKNKSLLFPTIAKDVFQTNLNYILLLRNEQQKDCPLTMSPIKVSLPVHLKKVILENIGHFKHIEINLDQQITCLIGENGSGKSSILRGIALGLTGINDNTVVNPKNIAIQKMLRLEKVDRQKEIYASNGLIKVIYNELEEKNVISFQYQGETVDNNGNISKNFINVEDDPNSDLTTTNANNFVNLVIGFSQIKSLLNGYSTSQNDNDDLKPRISEVTSLIYNQPDSAFNNFASWIIQLWSVKTKENGRQLKIQLLENIFSIIQKIVGGTFELMPMQIEQTEIFIKTTDAPEGIPIRLISQGYNNVIGWVGYFMQRLWEVTPEANKADFKRTPAICLIDEIDTYLHPKWEKTILSVLAQEFPNTQFVVTTHSPVVIANLQNNFRIYRIVKHNNLMMAFEHNNAQFKPYGAESSRILRLLMDVKQERPKEVQEMMDAYNKAILENDFEMAESFESQLKQLIDPNDPILVEGEATIEARKMLQEL